MTPEPIAIQAEISEQITDASNRQSSSWDMRNAPRNYISLIIFQAASAIFSFGAVWVITRPQHLGPEGFGGIIAIIAASQVAQVLVNWTSVAVVRFGVDEFIQTEKIARIFWIRFIVLSVNLVLVAGLAAFWFPPLAKMLKLAPGSLWLVLTHFAVTVVWIHLQMSMQGAKLLRMQGLLMMIERLLIFAGIIGLAATANLTEVAAILCYIAAPAAMVFFGVYQLRRYIFARFSVDRVFFRKIFAYSLPLLPFSLFGFFSGNYVDAVFVSNFFSQADLGVYALATQINGIALQLPTLANTLLLPLFVTLLRESDEQRTSNYFRNVLPSLTLLWGLACTGASFVAYFAIPIAFEAKFSGTALPLWILLTASAVGMPIGIGYSAFSNAASMTNIAMVASILAAVTNIAGNFLLIPRYGLAGCAFATLLAYFISLNTFALLLRRRAKTPISWSYAAFSPCVAGTIVFWWWQSAPLALVVCIAATLLVGLWFRESLSKTFLFLRNFRAAS